MRRKIVCLNNVYLECYFPNIILDSDRPLVLIALGIPRDGPNNKSYQPGTLFDQILQNLADRQINSCIVGIPGMGDSSGDTLSTTLQDRAEHLDGVLKYFPNSKIWFIGYSMGAAVVLLLLKQKINNVKGITLIAPASYPLGAENKKFGSDFKNELHYGTGNRLCYPQYLEDLPIDINCHLVSAQSDQVIPKFIYQSFITALKIRNEKGANTQLTVLPKASHNLIDGVWSIDMLVNKIAFGIHNSKKHKPRI